MKFRMSDLDVPEGVYTAQFVGCVEKDHPEYGAGVAWDFRIAEGPHKGKAVGRVTSLVPTDKNACGKILSGLLGRRPEKGEEFDAQQFAGRAYQVVVEENSTHTGTRVAKVLAVGGAEPNAAAAGTPPAAPPRKAAAAAQPPVGQMYWIDTGEEPTPKGNAEDVRAHIFRTGVKAAELPLCKVGENHWKPASDFGFEDARF